MHCSRCRTPAKPIWYYCPLCGERLGRESARDEVVAPLTTERRQSRPSMDASVSPVSPVARPRTQPADIDTSLAVRNLALIASRTHNGVILTDSRGRIEWINDGFTRMTGYILDEVRGRTPGSFLQGAESNRRTRDAMRKAVRAGRGFTTEIINYHKSGRKYWTAIEVQPIHDESDQLTHFMAIESDITERKRAEDELRENELKLRQSHANLERMVRERTIELQFLNTRLEEAQEMAHVGSFTWNITDHKSTWSRELFRIHGLPALAGPPSRESYLTLVHPEHTTHVAQAFETLLLAAEPLDLGLEYRVVRPSGETRWLIARWRMTFQAAGENNAVMDAETIARSTVSSDGSHAASGFAHHLPQIHRVIEGICQDFTDRRRADEALRYSEEKYRDLVETSRDLIWSINADERWIFVNNSGAREIYGYRPEEMLGRLLADFQSPLWKYKDAKVYARTNCGEHVLRYETVHLRKDGRPVVLLFSAIARYDETGQFLGATGTAADITERKQTEDALYESEKRFRSLVESAPIGVWKIDSDGSTIKYLNPALRSLLAIPRDEDVCGQSIMDFIAPECHNAVHDQLRLRECGLPSSYEISYLGRTGRRVPILVFGSPVVDRDGRLAGLVGMSIDLTDRKRHEEQMANLREELGQVARMGTMVEMASGVAHELNQPLAAIHLYASAALRLTANLELTDLQNCLSRIEQQSLRAGGIIHQMRSFIGRGSSRTERVDVTQLIHEVLLILKSDLLGDEIQLRLSLSEELPPVMIDGAQVQQAIVNLIHNAIDAMHGMEDRIRRLSIESVADNEGIRISISDNGCGIDASIADKLFHPFQSTKPGGMGLGLAICRTLIEAQGGRVDAIANPGGGTTFFFVLPAMETSRAL